MASKPLAPRIALHCGWTDPGYVWSPFVTKLELRMRLAGLSYTLEGGIPMKGPKGKILYIEIRREDSEPECIGDSSQIIEKLVEGGLLSDLNAKLGPVERAHDMALRALLEERLYFYQGYERWHENYYTMRDRTLASIPYPMRIIIGMLAYRKTMTTLRGQGTSRFSSEEIAGFRKDIWENINSLVVNARKTLKGTDDESRCFWVLGGDAPSEADAVLYGFIIGAVICTAAPASQKVVRSFPAIEDYACRIHDQYFPDYPRWDQCD